MSLTRTGVLPSWRVKAKTVLTAAGSLPSGAITSTSGILWTGLKKCIPTTRSRCGVLAPMPAIESDEVFEARTAPSAHVLRRLGEDLLLDAQVLDDRLDHQVAPAEARVVEGRQEEAHLAPRLGSGRAAAARTCLLKSCAACCMPLARASSSTSFMRTGSSVSAAMSWAMPPPITPAPSTAVGVHLARRGAGQAGLLLRLLGQPEDVDQVLRRPRGGELGHGPRLGVEAGARAVLDPHPHHLDGAQGRRVVAAGLLQGLLARLVEEDLPAQRGSSRGAAP